jgi:arylsulfatase A-like enzyme
MNRLGQYKAARGAALAALGAAALLGFADVALHGGGLEPWVAGATVLLWVLLAVPVGLGLGLAGWRWGARRQARSEASTDHPRARRIEAIAIGSLIGAPLIATGFAASRYEAPRLPASPAASALHAPVRNVVLIVLDTLRADHIGALGGAPDLTPRLDAFSQSAVSFERCFATASWTVPTHASLFTGLFSRSHGASFERDPELADRFTTLAEGMAQAGYRTAAFVSNPYLGWANLDQGFELFRHVTSPFSTLTIRKPLAALGGPARWIDEGATQTAREVEAFLRDRAHGDEKSGLLLFINLLEPHWRHLPPARQRHEATTDEGYIAATLTASRFYGPQAMARGALSAGDLDTLRALYAAEVRYQDERLGEILDAIDRRLDPRHTLLMITADHGENLGEAGRFDHIFALNDHLIRVPLFIRLPDRFPAGQKRTDLCQSVDIPATVRGALAASATTISVGVGRDLASPDEAPRRHIFAEGDPYLDHLARMREAGAPAARLAALAQPLRAVRNDRFKLVRSDEGSAKLYDVVHDPDEQEDVAARYPRVFDELASALDRWQRSQPAFPADTGRAPRTPSPETRARLEALGYSR